MIADNLAADRASIIPFLKGKASVNGPFWLVNLLRFKEGGVEEYKRYAAGIEPAMHAVGAKPVFSSYTCRTVVDGAGALFQVDGVFIGEYPSPSALVEMNKSEAYIKAHKHREAALHQTAMYAIPAQWLPAQSGTTNSTPDRSITAPESSKNEHQLEAINGNPEQFLSFIGDERFGPEAPVWMLNFLKFEPGIGAALYREYGVRAQSHIGRMKVSAKGGVGGLQLSAIRVHTLKGPQFDQVAIMRYPTRNAFLEYASGQGKGTKSGGGRDEVVAEGFKMREAGLAVQGLVCMSPSDPGLVSAQSRL